MRYATLFALVLAPLAQGQATDEEVREARDAFWNEYVMFLAEHQEIDIDETPMIEVAERTVGALPIDELTTDQIDYLIDDHMHSHLTTETTGAMFHRLRTIAHDERETGAERARAMAIGAWMPLGSYRHATRGSEEDRALQREMRRAFREHPERASVFVTPRAGVAAFLMLAPAEGEDPLPKENLDEVLAAIDWEGEDAAGIADTVWYWTKQFNVREHDPITDARRREIAELVRGIYEREARRLREEDPDRASYYQDLADRMTSPAELGTLIGSEAPALDIVWCGDERIEDLDDLSGKVVVIDFWTTWCGPCIDSFDHLRELRAQYSKDDVAILGVTSAQGRVYNLEPGEPIECDDTEHEIELLGRFAEHHDVTWTIVVLEGDRGAAFHPGYGVSGIPHVAIIDAKGRVRHNELRPWDEGIGSRIDELLAERGGRDGATRIDSP